MFPAHAGMIPRGRTGRYGRLRVPRACGDDPHILYGLDKGGAHLHGYGWQREQSYEFPESWGPEEIKDAGIRVLRMPGNMEHIEKLLADGHRRGSVKGTIDGVVVRVSFSKAGKSKRA